MPKEMTPTIGGANNMAFLVYSRPRRRIVRAYHLDIRDFNSLGVHHSATFFGEITPIRAFDVQEWFRLTSKMKRELLQQAEWTRNQEERVYQGMLKNFPRLKRYGTRKQIYTLIDTPGEAVQNSNHWGKHLARPFWRSVKLNKLVPYFQDIIVQKDRYVSLQRYVETWTKYHEEAKILSYHEIEWKYLAFQMQR